MIVRLVSTCLFRARVGSHSRRPPVKHKKRRYLSIPLVRSSFPTTNAFQVVIVDATDASYVVESLFTRMIPDQICKTLNGTVVDDSGLTSGLCIELLPRMLGVHKGVANVGSRL